MCVRACDVMFVRMRDAMLQAVSCMLKSVLCRCKAQQYHQPYHQHVDDGMHTVSSSECVTLAGGIQNRFGSLFFILIYMSVMSLSSLPLWMEDRLLFIRSVLCLWQLVC